MTRDIPDVEIVGASFAGLACATACAARGLTTTVWERRRDPGEHVHTTGLLVKEVADAIHVPSSLTRRIAGIRLYGPSHRWVDLDEPGYSFYATDTPALMRWFVSGAVDAGATIRWGSAWNGRRGSRFLVGADGPRSTVARAQDSEPTARSSPVSRPSSSPYPGSPIASTCSWTRAWPPATSDGSFRASA